MSYLKYQGTRNGDIYALIDPRTEQIAYVGKASKGMEDRLKGHRNDAEANTKRARSVKWQASLLRQGLEPIAAILESGSWTCDEINERERWWIDFFGGPGVLLNHTPGGDGGFNEGLLAFNRSEWTDERRERAAQAQRAYVERCRASGVEIDYSAMHIGAAAIHDDPERHAAWALAIGEGLARYNASLTDQQRDERRARLAVAAQKVDRSFQKTDEYRSKMSAAIRSSDTPERRAKLSAALHAHWGTEPWGERSCEICGKIFLPRTRNGKTCTRQCTGKLMWQIRRGERELGS